VRIKWSKWCERRLHAYTAAPPPTTTRRRPSTRHRRSVSARKIMQWSIPGAVTEGRAPGVSTALEAQESLLMILKFRRARISYLVIRISQDVRRDTLRERRDTRGAPVCMQSWSEARLARRGPRGTPIQGASRWPSGRQSVASETPCQLYSQWITCTHSNHVIAPCTGQPASSATNVPADCRVFHCRRFVGLLPWYGKHNAHDPVQPQQQRSTIAPHAGQRPYKRGRYGCDRPRHSVWWIWRR
jgi:hypothetical protein